MWWWGVWDIGCGGCDASAMRIEVIVVLVSHDCVLLGGTLRVEHIRSDRHLRLKLRAQSQCQRTHLRPLLQVSLVGLLAEHGRPVLVRRHNVYKVQHGRFACDEATGCPRGCPCQPGAFEVEAREKFFGAQIVVTERAALAHVR